LATQIDEVHDWQRLRYAAPGCSPRTGQAAGPEATGWRVAVPPARPRDRPGHSHRRNDRQVHRLTESAGHGEQVLARTLTSRTPGRCHRVTQTGPVGPRPSPGDPRPPTERAPRGSPLGPGEAGHQQDGAAARPEPWRSRSQLAAGGPARGSPAPPRAGRGSAECSRMATLPGRVSRPRRTQRPQPGCARSGADRRGAPPRRERGCRSRPSALTGVMGRRHGRIVAGVLAGGRLAAAAAAPELRFRPPRAPLERRAVGRPPVWCRGGAAALAERPVSPRSSSSSAAKPSRVRSALGSRR
jgi:hypothetical protein